MRTVRSIILSATALATMASALAENRSMEAYNSIIDRNPFNLKDPPPPPVQKPPEEKQEPKSEFYLAGITTVGFPKRPKAYLINKDQNKKDKEKYYSLTLNERSGDMTLTDIDVVQRKVKITYRGEEQWLSMKDNALPAAAMPQQPPGAPGAVPHLPGQVPTPLPMGGPNVAPAPQNNILPSPSLNRRIPRAGGMGAVMPNYNGVTSAPAAEPAVDPAEQYLRMKVNETMNKRANIPTPPIPGLPGGGGPPMPR